MDPEPVTEVDEEMVSDVDLNNTLTDEEREEILSELTKVVPLISTFHRSVFQCLAWYVELDSRNLYLHSVHPNKQKSAKRLVHLSHMGRQCWTMGEIYYQENRTGSRGHYELCKSWQVELFSYYDSA